MECREKGCLEPRGSNPSLILSILAWFKECNHVTSLSSATNLKLIDFLLLIAGAIYEMGNNGLEWSYKMEYKHNLWLWRSQFDITRVVYWDGEQTEEIKKALVLVGANQEAIICTAPILDNWFYANWGPAPCLLFQILYQENMIMMVDYKKKQLDNCCWQVSPPADNLNSVRYVFLTFPKLINKGDGLAWHGWNREFDKKVKNNLMVHLA